MIDIDFLSNEKVFTHTDIKYSVQLQIHQNIFSRNQDYTPSRIRGIFLIQSAFYCYVWTLPFIDIFYFQFQYPIRMLFAIIFSLKIKYEKFIISACHYFDIIADGRANGFNGASSNFLKRNLTFALEPIALRPFINKLLWAILINLITYYEKLLKQALKVKCAKLLWYDVKNNGRL